MAHRNPPHQVAYEQIGREARAFAKMVADFGSMGSGEFLKHYPDYAYDGTDHICRYAEALAANLTEYAAKFSSPSRKAA